MTTTFQPPRPAPSSWSETAAHRCATTPAGWQRSQRGTGVMFALRLRRCGAACGGPSTAGRGSVPAVQVQPGTTPVKGSDRAWRRVPTGSPRRGRGARVGQRPRPANACRFGETCPRGSEFHAARLAGLPWPRVERSEVGVSSTLGDALSASEAGSLAPTPIDRPNRARCSAVQMRASLLG